MSDNKAFATFTDADWTELHDYMWGQCVADLKIGRTIHEHLVLMRDPYGRPEMTNILVGELREELPDELRLMLMAALLDKHDALAYAHVSEAWMRLVTVKDYEKYERGDLKNYPDSKECLTLVLVTKGGLKLHRMGEIVRITGEREQGVAERVDTYDPIGKEGRVEGTVFDLFTHVKKFERSKAAVLAKTGYKGGPETVTMWEVATGVIGMLRKIQKKPPLQFEEIK